MASTKEALLTGDRNREGGARGAQAPDHRAAAHGLHGVHRRRAHIHADELGETFSDDMVERIEEKLGHPERCPHGWPIDPAFEQAENKELAPLADLRVGQAAEIVRLAEHDGELLHWFYDEGFVPGAHVVIREAQPAAGQFKVLLSGNESAIGEKAAAGLYVRPS